MCCGCVVVVWGEMAVFLNGLKATSGSNAVFLMVFFNSRFVKMKAVAL